MSWLWIFLFPGCSDPCQERCAAYEAAFIERMGACGMDVPGLAAHPCDAASVEVRECELACMESARCEELDVTGHGVFLADEYAACTLACERTVEQ
ncbi:MAG: hypothetical protein VX899_06710 [Myxococcota bacterium]|nr:hypothetical protein [Myxococcota bacterium]